MSRVELLRIESSRRQLQIRLDIGIVLAENQLALGMDFYALSEPWPASGL